MEMKPDPKISANDRWRNGRNDETATGQAYEPSEDPPPTMPPMGAADGAWMAAGLLVVAVVLADMTATLVVTWGVGGRWRPSRHFYAGTWRAWSRLCRAVDDVDRRERLLGVYGPLSLLALLTLWLLGLLLGWALVWVAFADDLGATTAAGAVDVGSLVYYSGVVLLTIGFGDLTADGLAPRMLTLAEAASGLASIALVISYLPVLYGAYGKRESQLLTLDHPSGERITPVSLLLLHSPGGDLDRLYRFFAEWERWTADVLESHTSYPMLALFRSQHRGQSWISALGVVADAAVLAICCIPGADRREPYFAYGRARRAVVDISRRLRVRPTDDTFLDRKLFGFAVGLLREAGMPLMDEEAAWTRLCELRPTYGAELQSLMDHLVAPPGFWGHSAGADLPQPSGLVNDREESQ